MSPFRNNSLSTLRKTPVLITVLLQNPKTYLQSKKAVLKYKLQEGHSPKSRFRYWVG